jgi:hypothetical protein
MHHLATVLIDLMIALLQVTSLDKLVTESASSPVRGLPFSPRLIQSELGAHPRSIAKESKKLTELTE